MTLSYKRIVSFARKRSSNPQKEAEILCDFLPQYAVITHEDGGCFEKISEIFTNNLSFKSYAMEIGFGSGENLLHLARSNSDIGYIGCEVFTGGVVKLLGDIKKNNINNIKIWYDDALELITRLPLNSLNLVYVLHPDPWPKKRHNKRRLINVEFLKFLSSKIAKNGELLIVTDHQDYASHIKQTILNVEDIYELKHSEYPEIVKTKYRLKAEARGIEPHYFYLVKK